MHRSSTIAIIAFLCTATLVPQPPARAVAAPALGHGASFALERSRLAGTTAGPRYPRLAGFLVPVEESLLAGLLAAGLNDRLIRIAVDTNGHLIAASLVLTFPESGPDAVPPLQARAVSLAAAAFKAVPALDELQLTAFHQESGYFNAYRSDVSFTAAISGADAAMLRRTSGPVELQMRAFRAWYHPTIRPATAPRNVDGPPRAHVAPKAPPFHGNEHATGFSGDASDRLLELRDRLAGHLRGQIVGGKIYRGPVHRRALALTFDDGPMPIYTTLLLDSLRREGLKATFFVIGQRIRQYPYLARAIVADGHEIANHTYSHVNLTHLSADDTREEIARAQRAILSVTGRTAAYFRMPGGQYNRAVLKEARRQNLTTVFWTAAPGDHHKISDEALQQRMMARVYNGGILLLHQGIPATLRMLPHVREMLQARGYHLSTVSGLMNGGAPTKAQR